jgi:hypothetical protein
MSSSDLPRYAWFLGFVNSRVSPQEALQIGEVSTTTGEMAQVEVET